MVGLNKEEELLSKVRKTLNGYNFDQMFGYDVYFENETILIFLKYGIVDFNGMGILANSLDSFKSLNEYATVNLDDYTGTVIGNYIWDIFKSFKELQNIKIPIRIYLGEKDIAVPYKFADLELKISELI